MLNLFTIRAQITKQRTQTMNACRAALYEMGAICSSGEKRLLDESELMLKNINGKSLAKDFSVINAVVKNDLEFLDNSIKTINKHLSDFAEDNECCRRLMTIPCIGAVAATAIYTVMGSPDNFEDARHFAAYAGYVPKITGTGGRIQVLHLKKSGNLLRKIMYLCALSYCSHISRKKKAEPEFDCLLLQKLSNAQYKKKVLIALANRMLRISWSLLKHKTDFEPSKEPWLIC